MKLDLSNNYTPQVVIVANGTLEQIPRIERLLEETPHILICDGATRIYARRYQRQPDAVIGDGDSVHPKDLERLGVSLTQIPDQETNDLTKAVGFALQKGWREICIIGGSGKREDHTIGNIALLAEYYKMGAVVRMVSGYGVMLPFSGVLRVKVAPLQQLSLFALSSAPLSARGVAYPFEQRSFNALWEATLNYAVSDMIEVESAEVALLYIADEIRKETCK